MTAIDLGYSSVVSPLLNFAIDRSSRCDKKKFPVHLDDLTLIQGQYHAPRGSLHHALVASLQTTMSGGEGGLELANPDGVQRAEEAKAILSGQLTTAQSKKQADGEVRQMYPAGWTIPSAACRRAGVRCFVTGHHIQGPEVWLSQLTPQVMTSPSRPKLSHRSVKLVCSCLWRNRL